MRPHPDSRPAWGVAQQPAAAVEPASEPRCVVRAHDQLAALDDLPVPGQDDEVLGLESVEVGRVVAGLEGDGALHLRWLERPHLAQRELHGAPRVARLIHHQDAASPDRGGRTSNDDRLRVGLLPAYHHGDEVALHDRCDDDAGDDTRLGNAEHDLRLILPGDAKRQRATELAEEGPVDFEDATRGGLLRSTGGQESLGSRVQGPGSRTCGCTTFPNYGATAEGATSSSLRHEQDVKEGVDGRTSRSEATDIHGARPPRLHLALRIAAITGDLNVTAGEQGCTQAIEGHQVPTYRTPRDLNGSSARIRGIAYIGRVTVRAWLVRPGVSCVAAG